MNNKRLNEIVNVIEQAIEKYGPMEFKSLKYFVTARLPQISQEEFKDAIALAKHQKKLSGGGSMINGEYEPNYKLPHLMDSEPSLPKDFVKAYFDLLERTNFIKEHPEYANAPEEWLEKIFPPII